MSFFKSIHSLKSAMFNVYEQDMGRVVGSRRFLTVMKAHMHDLVQTKREADTFVLPVLSNTSIVVLMAETVGKFPKRTVDE